MKRVTGGWDSTVETVRHPRFPHAFVVVLAGREIECVFGDKHGRMPEDVDLHYSQQVARDVIEIHFGGVPWRDVRDTFEHFVFPNLTVLDLNGCHVDHRDAHLLHRLLSASSRVLRSLDLSHNRKLGHLLTFQIAIRSPAALRRVCLRDMFWDGEDLLDTVRDIARRNADVQFIDVSHNRRPVQPAHVIELDRLLATRFRKVARGYLRDAPRIKHTGVKKVCSVKRLALE